MFYEYYTRRNALTVLDSGDDRLKRIVNTVNKSSKELVDSTIIGKSKVVARSSMAVDDIYIVFSVYRYWKLQRWLKRLFTAMAR